jgi:hypothetical protein
VLSNANSLKSPKGRNPGFLDMTSHYLFFIFLFFEVMQIH